MFYIVRNQKSNLEIGIHVKERPKIPAPEFRYEEIEIPGRSGTLDRLHLTKTTILSRNC